MKFTDDVMFIMLHTIFDRWQDKKFAAYFHCSFDEEVPLLGQWSFWLSKIESD